MYAQILTSFIPDQRTVYHVMSRTALNGFPFQDTDKDQTVELI